MCLLYELLPEEFRTHRRAARRERLLGWRVLVDAALERLDEPAAHAGGAAPGRSARGDFWRHRRAARREEMLALRSLFEGCLLGCTGWLEKPARGEGPTRIEIV